MTSKSRPISISNIAWPAEDDDEALALAARLGFDGIEVAPIKLFGALAMAPEANMRDYRARLADLGFAIPAMQGLLFGVDGATLFGPPDEEAALATALERVARVAGILGAGACVFGAPRLRDPGTLSPDAAFERAAGFFRRLAPIFAKNDSIICFEANAPGYGCRFVTRTSEAIALAEAVATPGFALQIDTGTVFAMDEPLDVVARAVPHAGHFHASEPELAPVGSRGSDHQGVADRLEQAGYARWRSVEMRVADDWRSAMRSAADLMHDVYQ